MVNPADRLADQIISGAVDLSRFIGTAQNEVTALLFKLQKSLVAEIRDSGIDSPSARIRRERLQELLRSVRASTKDTYAAMATATNSNMMTVGEIATLNTGQAIEKVLFKGSVNSVTLTPEKIKRIADNTMVMGAPQRDWWRNQEASTVTRVQSQIRQGLTAGEGIDDIVTRIQGRGRGVENVVTMPDGTTRVIRTRPGAVLKMSDAQARAMVATSSQTVQNQSLLDTYKANDDVIKGVEAQVTLDTRTTELCMGRSGGMWNIKTGEPLPGSTVTESFPGSPPWHWNCRTVLIPIIKSFEELGFNTKKDIKPSTQSSMNGQVPAELTYNQWLKQQPKAVQVEALGPTKQKLWEEGKITLADLVDQSGNPLTVTELKEKYDS